MPPPGTGTSNVPANILIMLDNSGSMTWDIDGNYISSWTKMVNNPWASAVDSRGWVYVYELYNRRIMVFDDGGNRKFNKGSYGYGCNQFLYVNRMQIHNDIIYLLDSQTGTVKKLNQSLKLVQTKEPPKSAQIYVMNAKKAATKYVAILKKTQKDVLSVGIATMRRYIQRISIEI